MSDRPSPLSAFLRVAAITGAALLMIGSVFAWDPPLAAAKAKAKVRPRVLGEKTTRDTDGDGTIDAKDLDDDNDGLPDAWDPLTLANDLDNDGKPNKLDKDDDGDGILDTRDRVYDAVRNGYRDRSLDENNNDLTDMEERYVRGHKFDGDKDGRGDLAELKGILTAQARVSRVAVPAVTKTLADFPGRVLNALPDRWWNVIHDRDNDGIPAGMDTPETTPVADPYRAYTDEGTWEKTYNKHGKKGDLYGFVPLCLSCSGTELGVGAFSIPHYTRPLYESAGGVKRLGIDITGSAGAGTTNETKYDKHFFGGRNTVAYTSVPQFRGGSYLRPAGTVTGVGGRHSGGQSGGSWLSGGASGGTGGGTGGGGGNISGGGADGGGGGTGFSGGGGGGCSKC